MTSKYSNKRKNVASLLIFIYNADMVDKIKETGPVCILKVHFLSNKRKSRSIPYTRTKKHRGAKRGKLKRKLYRRNMNAFKLLSNIFLIRKSLDEETLNKTILLFI